MKVQRPGSRGGHFWVDDIGNIRYGAIPQRYRETLQQRAFQEWFHKEIMAGRLPKIEKPQDQEKLREWWESTVWAQAARESQQKIFKSRTKGKLALLPSKKNPRVKRWQRVAIDPKDFKKHGIQEKATDAFEYTGHPKWTHEWRDPKDRLIRRYTPEYIEKRAILKFKRVEKAIKHIPELRAAVQKNTRSRNPRRRVLALVITTLDQTGMRVGTTQHNQRYGTYGATTLTNDHVTVKGDTVTISYTGKKSKEQKHTITNPTYARQIRKLLKQEGDQVFAYTENGKTKSITSDDVNNYLKRYGITAKDIRTFKANVVFTSALRRMGKAKDEKQAKKNINVALDEAAEHLGNTRNVCKTRYVSPEIINAYLEGKRLKTRYLRKSLTSGWTEEEKKFIRLWNELKQGMKKSRVRQHLRRTKSGKLVSVKEYDTSKTKSDKTDFLIKQTEIAAKQMMANPKLNEYKAIIQRKVDAMKKNPTTKTALNALEDFQTISKYAMMGKKTINAYRTVFQKKKRPFAFYIQRSAGIYVALDKPYVQPGGKVTKVKVTFEPKNIYDPNGVLEGTDKAKSQKDSNILIDRLNQMHDKGEIGKGSKASADSQTKVLQGLGYDGEAGWIDSPNGNRELILFDPDSVKHIKKSLTFSGHKLQGRTTFQGMKISIENKAGTYRTGKDPDGHEWKTKLHFPYGYIRGTVGVDKDHVDCFIGKNPNSQKVFVIHQKDIKTGKYDEDKVMLGWDNKKRAIKDYLINYDRKDMLGSVTEMTHEQFKKKAFAKKYNGKMIKAYGQRLIYRASA